MWKGTWLEFQNRYNHNIDWGNRVYFDIDTIELQGELQESAKAGEVGEKDGELWEKDSVSARENGPELCSSEESTGMEGKWGIVDNTKAMARDCLDYKLNVTVGET